MGLYIQLHLLGLMLITKMYELNREEHPVLQKVLESLGIYHDTPMGRKEVGECFYVILSALEKRFSYYDSTEITTNKALNDYLKDVFDDLKNGTYERSKTLAVAICGMGNKGGDMNAGESVGIFLDEAQFMLNKLSAFYAGEEDLPLPIFQAYIRQLEYIDKVMELTDVFVTSRLGAMYGGKEYPEVALEDLPEPPEPDFSVGGLECSSAEDCECGCVMDHPMKIIDGMEDFLNGVESPNRDYFTGVAKANNIRLEGYTGQEGPVFDAIKDLAMKSWTALTDSLGAIKDLFSTGKSEDKVKVAERAAESNKKALQSMKAAGAVINSKAREGLTNLMTEIDPSGKAKNLVSQLRSPADAPKVIDALMGLMSKEATAAGKLNKEINDAQKAVGEIKTAASDATGDETNKDVAAAKKAKVQSKVAAGKESLKKVKLELAGHTKLMQGIQKAIAGISPKIFILDKTKETKDE